MLHKAASLDDLKEEVRGMKLFIKKIKVIPTGNDLGTIALTPQGELLVADKGSNKKGFGIRIYDASSGQEVTTTPIPTGASLPPTIIRVFETTQANLP